MFGMNWLLNRRSLAAVFGAAALVVASTAPALAAGRKPSDVPSGDTVRVSRVIDASTIEVTLNGAPTLVRYLGVTTPTGSECLATQATQANAALVAGKLVRLERDATNADDQGRLLRYVYVLDGRMAQEELLAAGLARAEAVEPNVKYTRGLTAIETAAVAKKAGGWARCGWQTIATVSHNDGCVTIEVERLMERRTDLPELARVKPGDCVYIHKASNAAGPEWAGEYLFQPAGTAVTPGTMYVRWKDAFMLMSREKDGVVYANVVRDSYKKRIMPWDRGNWDTVPGSTRVSQQVLVPDSADPSILVLPNPRTFLFRDLGNGKWQALVDVFVYRSGDARAPRFTVEGLVE